MKQVFDFQTFKVTLVGMIPWILTHSTFEGWFKAGAALGVLVYVWRKALAKEIK